MSLPPKEFAKRMSTIANNVEKSVNKIIVESVLEGMKELAVITPVDTGRAVSNWRIFLNDPGSGRQYRAHFPGQKGSTADRNAAKMVEMASNKLKAYKETDIIFITNGLPYIQRLNQGWSNQAPAGFVERAISKIRSKVAQSKITVAY